MNLAKLLITLIILLMSSNVFAQRYELDWSDEFNGTELNRDTWTPWFGTAYNNELQYYTSRSKNLRVANGNLEITGYRENFGGRKWTSARIKTEGAKDFKYGKVEIRAKLPKGRGLWPAFWMLPTNIENEVENPYGGWPYSGEIDILENRGHDMQEFQTTVHFSGVYPGSGNPVADRRSISSSHNSDPDSLNNFNIYGLEWTNSFIAWFFNGVEVYRLTKDQIEESAAKYPFDEPFYIILNLAIGGDYLADKQPDGSTPDVNKLVVDYVRLYQDINEPPTISTNLSGELDVEIGSEVLLNATVSDSDGTVDSVKFYIDDTLIGTVTEQPYETLWIADINGCRDLSIEAFDNDKGVSRYEEGIFVVGSGCTQKPYSDSSVIIPGTLELENFDLGGQDVAYYDLTPDTNSGGKYRLNDAVDLIADPNDDQNYGLQNLEEGEWTEYSVKIEKSGYYELSLSTFTDDKVGRTDLIIDGEVITTFYQLFGSCCKTRSNVLLEEGEYILRVQSEQSSENLDRINFTLLTEVNNEQSNDQFPTKIQLHQNYPNPFNPSTVISFSLEQAMKVKLSIFNAVGQEMDIVFEGNVNAGTHTFNYSNMGLSNGVYFYRLTTEKQSITKTMILIK